MQKQLANFLQWIDTNFLTQERTMQQTFIFERDTFERGTEYDDNWWYTKREFVYYGENKEYKSRNRFALCPDGVEKFFPETANATRLIIEVTDFDQHVSNCLQCWIPRNATDRWSIHNPNRIHVENPNTIRGFSGVELSSAPFCWLYNKLKHQRSKGKTPFWITVNWEV